MIPSSDTLTHSPIDLIERARAGDQEAWTELFDRAYPKIRRSIRRKMDGRMRRRCDSVDIANSVMKDFCVKFGELDFPTEGAVHAFLLRAAEQKLIDEHRKQHGLKRDIRLERPADGALGVASRGPTPSHIVEAKEDYQLFLEALSPEERRIALMKAEGRSTEEIADETGRHPRSLQRWFLRLRNTFLD